MSPDSGVYPSSVESSSTLDTQPHSTLRSHMLGPKSSMLRHTSSSSSSLDHTSVASTEVGRSGGGRRHKRGVSEVCVCVCMCACVRACVRACEM